VRFNTAAVFAPLACGKREGLEKLQEKALAGSLRDGELAAFRQLTRRSSDESGNAYLSALRALRKRLYASATV
jgi:hypothetical protein